MKLLLPAMVIALLPALPRSSVVPTVVPVSAEPALSCPRAEDPKYVGSKSCQKCHYKEYTSWAKTEMALAFGTLKADAKSETKKKAGLDGSKDYTKDAKCVACHTTGYGKPGGYPAITDKEWTAEEKERAALFEGVGCESCHGPGEKTSPFKKENKEYKWADLAKLGAVHPDEKSCAVCHSKESPSFKEFKFEEKVGKDTHEILKLKADHGCDHKHAGK
jgi:formate-dependent nitrite reductase cytochrome c552 subunit